MNRYSIELTRSARRGLFGTPQPARRRLEEAIDALGDDPRPRGSLKLTGSNDEWRIRIGQYRVIYRIDEDARVVSVAAVGPRGDVYRSR